MCICVGLKSTRKPNQSKKKIPSDSSSDSGRGSDDSGQSEDDSDKSKGRSSDDSGQSDDDFDKSKGHVPAEKKPLVVAGVKETVYHALSQLHGYARSNMVNNRAGLGASSLVCCRKTVTFPCSRNSTLMDARG